MPCIKVYRSGPDFAGEHPTIKDATQFNDCFTEVISQLTSLETFRWESDLTPIPADVFEILRHVQLRQLHTPLWYSRRFHQRK